MFFALVEIAQFGVGKSLAESLAENFAAGSAEAGGELGLRIVVRKFMKQAAPALVVGVVRIDQYAVDSGVNLWAKQTEE